MAVIAKTLAKYRKLIPKSTYDAFEKKSRKQAKKTCKVPRDLKATRTAAIEDSSRQKLLEFCRDWLRHNPSAPLKYKIQV